MPSTNDKIWVLVKNKCLFFSVHTPEHEDRDCGWRHAWINHRHISMACVCVCVCVIRRSTCSDLWKLDLLYIVCLRSGYLTLKRFLSGKSRYKVFCRSEASLWLARLMECRSIYMFDLMTWKHRHTEYTLMTAHRVKQKCKQIVYH